MEKPLAMKAGIGWQGKHTNIVSKEYGSWLFLSSIFLDITLESNDEMIDHCGSCQRCIDICPTDAIERPYHVNASKCISYLTIEHKSHIPEIFRKKLEIGFMDVTIVLQSVHGINMQRKQQI